MDEAGSKCGCRRTLAKRLKLQETRCSRACNKPENSLREAVSGLFALSAACSVNRELVIQFTRLPFDGKLETIPK